MISFGGDTYGNDRASAFRAERITVVTRSPDLPEDGLGFLIRHARNGAQRERPCGCGEEEVKQSTTASISPWSSGQKWRVKRSWI